MLRRLGAAGVLAFIVAVVVGPLAGGVWSPAPPATPAPVPTTAPSRPPALPSATTYREAVVGLPASLNPLLASGDADQDVVQLVFAGLTRLDGRGGVEPDLAESWSVAATGTVYTFLLRQNATWHDGQPVTSRDVLFTVRLLQETKHAGAPGSANFWRTVRVDAAGPHSVRFTLSEAYVPFPGRTTFPLLPAHLLHGVYSADLPQHSFSQQPIGAGPYRVGEPLRDGDLHLVAHARHHGGPPAIEHLLLRFYPTADDAVAALVSGAVDGMAGVPAARLPEVRQRVAGLHEHTEPVGATMSLVINLRRAPFQQREVRQAIAMAIDRAVLIREALDTAADPCPGPILPTSWAYTPPRDNGTVHVARSLLEQGGWFLSGNGAVRERDGRPLTINLLATDSPERARVAVVIARQLAEIGIRVSITTVPARDILPRYLASRDFDAVLFGAASVEQDPDPYASWHSSQAEHGYNFAGWSLPRADELLEGARQLRDREGRQQRYADFQQLFADEAPSVPLYCPRYAMVTTSRVHLRPPGPLSRPADRFRRIAEWTIDPEQAVG